MSSTLSPIDNNSLPSIEQLVALINSTGKEAQQLRDCAVRAAIERFGRHIYIRGLIEISSHCRNNCIYCGLRRDNISATRYRLTAEQILECCQQGYSVGVRTFVLQGGEDNYWSDERLVPLVEQIKQRFPEAAITLSLGERNNKSYHALRIAGASRYLLRHEAADRTLYEALHPSPMSFDNRMAALQALKDYGYQVGAGMMVGVGNQRSEDLANDLIFLASLHPQMVGIGPFIPHPQTPLALYPAGDINKTLNCIAIARLLLPNAFIPATTAIATLCSDGHKRAIEAGANVIMPNLSPLATRHQYEIYAGKAATGTEAIEGLKTLEAQLALFGYEIDYAKADYYEQL